MTSPRPIFVHDQFISRLTLRADGQGNKRAILQGDLASALDAKRGSDSRWVRLRDRLELFELFDKQHRVLMAVTSYAGIGKSIVLHQLEAMLPQVRSDLVTVRVQFRDLPNDWQHYLRENVPNQTDPFLIKKVFDELIASLSTDTNPDKGELATWIEAMVRTGSLVLIVDGFDEYNGTDASTKASELRKLLDIHPRLHCVAGGRPYAITETVWKVLFSKDPDISRRGSADEDASDWDIYQVELFDREQTERFLGKELAALVRELQADMEISPRSLEVLRTLDPQVIATLRSTADLYWHATNKSLPLDDREGMGRELVHTDLKIDEILHMLSAIGITMALWHDDPRFPIQSGSSSDEFGTGVRLPTSSTGGLDRQTNPGAIAIGDGTGSLQEFQTRLFARLCDIYPEWKQLDRQTKRPLVEYWWSELQRLNSQYVEFRFFEAGDGGSIRWRNATMRDFFAALWMTTRANDAERAAFYNRIDMARDQRDSSIAETWRMICGMPEVSHRLATGATTTDKNLPWLRMVKPLYVSPNEAPRSHGRPTELMYRAWPGLLYRGGFLSTLAWSEEDLLMATSCAQRFFDPKEVDPGDVSSRDDKAWTLVGSFLKQYLSLRDGGGESATIIHEDLEDHWCDCKSHAGMTVRVGYSSHRQNPEHDETLAHAFKICAYQVTNRLYALFDPHHAPRFGDYNRYSLEPRCPAIYLTWYDAMMMSIWCHGYLPSEWEWEYASRADRRNEDGSNAIYYWGNDEALLTQYAWVPQNSGDRTHPVGSHPGRRDPKNDFGLYDSLGNVIEWTLSRYSKKNSRRVVQRGSSFVYPAHLINCWYREINFPWVAVNDFGFRVSKPR